MKPSNMNLENLRMALFYENQIIFLSQTNSKSVKKLHYEPGLMKEAILMQIPV